MNIHMNPRMAALYYPSDTPLLPGNLKELLLAGFLPEGQCVFLKKLYEAKGNATKDAFPDDIGYECFVNHFHFNGRSERELASIALEFCKRAIDEWRKSRLSGELQFIISISDNECTLRFHRIRGGIQWIDDELSLYKEAILVCDSANDKI